MSQIIWKHTNNISFRTRYKRSLVRHQEICQKFSQQFPSEEPLKGKRKQSKSPNILQTKTTKPSPLTPKQQTISQYIGQAATPPARSSFFKESVVYNEDTDSQQYLNCKYC